MSFWGEVVALWRGGHPAIQERYTRSARRVVSYARQEAVQRGASAVTVADLLGGLTLDDESRAVRVGSLKANAFYLRWLVGLPALPAYAADGAVEESRIELNAEVRRALGCAVLEADRDREYWIDTDHLLRGLLRFPNSAHFAVLKTELDLRGARAGSRSDREQFPPQEAPDRKVFEYLFRRYFELVVPPVISLVCYVYILLQGIGMNLLPLAR
jgi:hypothetical protein